MILQHLQYRGDDSYVLPDEDLRQIQRSLLDINNLLTVAYKELLEENQALKQRLDEARRLREAKS